MPPRKPIRCRYDDDWEHSRPRKAKRRASRLAHRAEIMSAAAILTAATFARQLATLDRRMITFLEAEAAILHKIRHDLYRARNDFLMEDHLDDFLNRTEAGLDHTSAWLYDLVLTCDHMEEEASESAQERAQ